MKLELTGLYGSYHYPKKKLRIGTAHFYNIDKNHDVRGVRWYQQPDGTIEVRWPVFDSWDYEERKRVCVPVIQYTLKEDNEAFLEAAHALITSEEIEKIDWKRIVVGKHRFMALLYGQPPIQKQENKKANTKDKEEPKAKEKYPRKIADPLSFVTPKKAVPKLSKGDRVGS